MSLTYAGNTPGFDQSLLDDFALAATDFCDIENSAAVRAINIAIDAMRNAIEIARCEEQKAAYWTKKVNDWVSWSHMPEGNTRRRAAALVCGDFQDVPTAIDFLSCPPLDGLAILELSSGGRIPTNAYEIFASRRRGGLATEMEIAEISGPVERYTYRLRMLRNLGESRSKIYQWRRMARKCRFRLLNKPVGTNRMAPSIGTNIKLAASDNSLSVSSGVENDVVFSDRVARSRDGPCSQRMLGWDP